MKNNLRKTFALTIFCLILGSAVAASGQTRPLLGGYKKVAADDENVQEAAKFAVETKAAELEQELTLDNVISAEQQIVQGKNFRLCLQVTTPAEEGEDTVQRWIKAIVYQSLDGEFALKSWAEEDCAEK